MATRNLVTDFGGVGDGQRQTGITTTINAGGTTLTAGTAIFSATTNAEAGKKVSVYRYIAKDDPTNYSYFGTITASTSTTLTMTPIFTPSALAGLAADIKWGTDNAQAIVGTTGSWRAWARTQTNSADPPVLQIPNGRFLVRADAQDAFNWDVPNPKWVGLSGNADACILSNLVPAGEMRFGGDVVIKLGANPPGFGSDDTNGNSVKILTALAGQMYVDLIPANISIYGPKIVTNRWCLIAGYDVQGSEGVGYGYPPNGQFYEWNYITGYSAGRVTLRTPLTQVYKSTWPEWWPRTGVPNDSGGPATLWVAPAGYDNTVELNDFTIESPAGSSCQVQSVIMRRIKTTGGGMYPTQNKLFYADTCVWPSQIEVDKMVDVVQFDNCTLYGNQQQSASPNRIIFNGGTVQSMGTAKYTEANNVTFVGVATLMLGVYYGNVSRLVMNNCTGITTLNSTPAANTSDFTDVAWVGGLLRYKKSTRAGLSAWMVPGAWLCFNDNQYIDRITDVTMDATYCYVQFANTTNWPVGTPTNLTAHPMSDITVRGCTGSFPEMNDWNNAPARLPFRSYVKRTYVAGASTANLPTGDWPKVWGRPTSIKHTVSSLFTGGTTLGFKVNLSNNWIYVRKESDNAAISPGFGSFIDMKIAGTRTMANATAPSGNVGTDVQYDFTSQGSVWFYSNAFSSPGFTTSSASSTWVPVTGGDTPTVTVEFTMDQGIGVTTSSSSVAPLYLRVRA